ncbi:hypothetical protein MKW98_029798 [Papaver atlanticum]|uniref:Uncharacterized protein n=1 Tax=Papaver atlanticum TaxID=357466 RepID=A0AAD4T817_9MAGN|nr:hypothetical protein MKW98_029798 [Papaver atlanticum]
MGRSYFLGFLLFSAVLLLCSSQGSGRKLMTLEINEDSTGAVLLPEARKMIEIMDYNPDPEANTNSKSAFASPLSPPPPAAPPHHHRNHD